MFLGNCSTVSIFLFLNTFPNQLNINEELTILPKKKGFNSLKEVLQEKKIVEKAQNFKKSQAQQVKDKFLESCSLSS